MRGTALRRGPATWRGETREDVWLRRSVSASALALGMLDIALAAARHPAWSLGILDAGRHIALTSFARYYLLAAGVCLVLVSHGLLRAQRNAWRIATVASAASCAAYLLKHADVGGAAIAAAVGVMLIGARAGFHARSNALLARRSAAVFLIGEGAVLLYGTIGLYWADPVLHRDSSLGGAAGAALRLLLLLPDTIAVRTHHERFVIESVHLAALMVAVTTLAMLIATVAGRPGTAAQRSTVESLLASYATGSLAHFALLDDKNWLIAQDGQAFIPYVVRGTTAVALGDPIGAERSQAAMIQEFLQMCSGNGWTPGFHQLTPEGAQRLAAAGLTVQKIGEEATLDLATWSLEGRPMRSIRSAVRKCERAGHRVMALPHPIDEANLARIKEVSDAWLAEGGHRERTFTLGQFDPQYLRATPVLVVVDDTDTSQAFANILPPYRSSDRTFDLMRRRPGSLNGVMDVLFVALIDRFRADGATGMDLGLAPLSGMEEDKSAAGRLMHLAYTKGDDVFRYAGLRQFKDKWQPRWEPRYVGAPTDAALPKVLAAIARAGELPDLRSPTGRAKAIARAFPFTIGFAVLQLWIMTAGQISPGVHEELLEATGTSWQALAHGQVWRLLTSPLVQSSPGFLWSNIKLLVIVLPLAEWRLGTKRAAAVFFLGDMISSIPTLIALRIAAAVGSTTAARLVDQPDGGTSAGSWALYAAVAWTLPTKWLRYSATGLVVFLLSRAAWQEHRLFDFQHLGSAAGAILLIEVGRRLTKRRKIGQREAVPAIAIAA